jgi:hypothetical protein
MTEPIYQLCEDMKMIHPSLYVIKHNYSERTLSFLGQKNGVEFPKGESLSMSMSFKMSNKTNNISHENGHFSGGE